MEPSAERVDIRLRRQIQAGEMPGELVVCGPAGTGKTYGILSVIHCLCRDNPGLRVLFLRAHRSALTESTLVTFEQRVLPADGYQWLCENQQRQNRQSYRYPNGSEIVLCGLNLNPTKVRSSEWDIIFANEAIELSQAAWEEASSRLGRPGRATKFGWMIGDTNPAWPTHWLKKRCDEGKATLWTTLHKANPAMYGRGGWTPSGRRYIAEKLEPLTGTRRLRLAKGIWAGAEGLIYEDWSPDVHLIDRFPIPASWPRYRSIDFGYTNPFSCQWWAADEDNRLYMYRQIYMSHRMVSEHAGDIKRLSGGERISATVADHDAEDRATLRSAGIHTVAANKAVKTGIQAVEARLRRQGDGRPRLFILRDSLVESDYRLAESSKPDRVEAEFDSYIWAPPGDGRAPKEEPLKLNDHGLDALRYMVAYMDHRTGHGVLL